MLRVETYQMRTAEMTYIVYRCDLIGFRQAPHSEVEVARRSTFDDAADLATAMKRDDTAHSYTIGIG